MMRLGELESAVMQVLWSADGPLRVREVMDLLESPRPHAYTTVMTVLDNLHGKGMADRALEGRAYRYFPAKSRSEHGAEMLRQVLTASGDPENVLLHFARSASEEESAFLRKALRKARGAPAAARDPEGDGA